MSDQHPRVHTLRCVVRVAHLLQPSRKERVSTPSARASWRRMQEEAERVYELLVDGGEVPQ